MPTSSQALILLSTDGQLPRYISTRKFPVSSIPYPLRSLDINAVSKDYEDSLSDFEPPFYDKKRHTRIQLESITESLPELLSVRGYRGSLSYDPETKVIKWQVNTELPKETMFPQLTFKTNQLVHFVGDDQNATTLPQIDVDRPFRIPNLAGTSGSRDDPDVLAQKTEDLRQYFSLPKIYKATVDSETYKRLCDLGFRKPSYDDVKKEKTRTGKEDKIRHVEFIEIPSETCDTDGTEDKDFRIEDLNLNPDSARMAKMKLSSSSQFPNLSKNEHFKKFFAERDTFINKHNYENGDHHTRMNGHKHPEHNLKDHIRKRHKLKLSEATLFPDSEMYITRTSKRSDVGESDSEKETFRQPLSLLEDVKEMSNYNKWKKARITSIRLRKEAPPPQPLAICFSLPDNAKPHQHVKALVESQIGTPVVQLQFDPVAVHAIDRDAKSRWVVTLSDYESRDLLVECGLIVNGEKIDVRRYDDVTRDEVQAYKIFELIQKGRSQNEMNQQKLKRRKSRAR
ncbi:unnamed protein product [Mytilus coruscus]|uniref:Uncharacterized protein n=1 Tax=Mytilus coruscus TaxID=42192 RepID=A0A6J8ARY9_MYTCO|nr:unnamed protein product [Mytilus coruscus]